MIAYIENGVQGLMALRNDNGKLVDLTLQWLGASLIEKLLSSGDFRTTGLEVHDFNGDGILDLSFAHYGIDTNQLSLYLRINNGRGKFSPMPNANTGNLEILPVFLDYDVDGDVDIVGFRMDNDELPSGGYRQKSYEIIILENTRKTKPIPVKNTIICEERYTALSLLFLLLYD